MRDEQWAHVAHHARFIVSLGRVIIFQVVYIIVWRSGVPLNRRCGLLLLLAVGSTSAR